MTVPDLLSAPGGGTLLAGSGGPLTNSPTMGRRLARGPPAGTQEGGRTTRLRMAGLLAHPSVAKAEARDASRCYKAQVEAGRHMWSPPGGAVLFAGEAGCPVPTPRVAPWA